MENVVKLPDRGDRAWAQYVATLTNIAVEEGYEPEVVTQALGELKPFFLEAWQRHHAPPSEIGLDAYVDQLKEWVGHYSLALLGIALMAKLELLEARAGR